MSTPNSTMIHRRLRFLRRRERLYLNSFICFHPIFTSFHRVPYEEALRILSELYRGADVRFWERLGIPFVPSVPGIGSLDLENQLHTSDQQRFQEYGRIFGTYEGRTPVMVVCDPEMISDILHCDSLFPRRVFLCNHDMYDNMMYITEDDEQWVRIRNIIVDQFFAINEIKKVTPTIVECAAVAVGSIRINNQGKGVVKDGVKVCGAFSVDLMCRIVFGRPSASYCDQDKLMKNAAKLLKRRDCILLENVIYPELRRIPENCPFDPAALKYFKERTGTEVYLRENDVRQRQTSDLLKVLLRQEAEGGLSKKELLSQCTMLIALSYPSISMTIAAACWEISQNEEIQNRLRAEIDGKLIRYGKLYSTALNKMKYLEQVLKETMRKYPAAARIERVCIEDTDIGSIPVKRGTVCAIPVYALHHDPAIYKEPGVFDPERFLVQSGDTFYLYLPFGEGCRKCLAYRFAMCEMKTFMAFLLSQFQLIAPKDIRSLTFDVQNNIMVPGKIPFRVRKRDNRVWIPPDLDL